MMVAYVTVSDSEHGTLQILYKTIDYVVDL